MNVRQVFQIIAQALREGVVLSAGTDGQLGWRDPAQPSAKLLIALKEHEAEILELLAPPFRSSPAVLQAKFMVWQLRARGFRPHLNEEGALLISDATGLGRSPSKRLPVGEVFDTLVAGLAYDPELLEERQ